MSIKIKAKVRVVFLVFRFNLVGKNIYFGNIFYTTSRFTNTFSNTHDTPLVTSGYLDAIIYAFRKVGHCAQSMTIQRLLPQTS